MNWDSRDYNDELAKKALHCGVGPAAAMGGEARLYGTCLKVSIRPLGPFLQMSFSYRFNRRGMQRWLIPYSSRMRRMARPNRMRMSSGIATHLDGPMRTHR